MNVGTRIQCTSCKGRHTGTVVAEIVPGHTFGVAWDDRNPFWGRPGNLVPQFPTHFVAAHWNHVSFTVYKAIRPQD